MKSSQAMLDFVLEGKPVPTIFDGMTPNEIWEIVLIHAEKTLTPELLVQTKQQLLTDGDN